METRQVENSICFLPKEFHLNHEIDHSQGRKIKMTGYCSQGLLESINEESLEFILAEELN